MSERLSDQSVRIAILSEIQRELGSLLWLAEEHYGDNAAGMYPSEVEMTLRIAYTATCRALQDAKQEPIDGIGPA